MIFSKSSVLFLSLVAMGNRNETTVVSAQRFCTGEARSSAPSSICDEIRFETVGGACSDPVLICDDGDATTDSVCDATLGRCSHVSMKPSSGGVEDNVTDAAPVCFSDCVPNCEGKQCGEDDCGGFCGVCETGFGCSNFACVSGLAEGSCASPLFLGNVDEMPIIDLEEGGRITVVTTGDTTSSIHIETPSCNTLTASPELVYAFEVPEGKTYGYDMRASGYDTVLQLMKDVCLSTGQPGDSAEDQAHILACNDDGTPPGDLGSKVFGELSGPGTFFVMVDGYSTTDTGPFELVTTFVDSCVPLCDGNFCGPDGCGGVCGSCSEGEECNLQTNRCYPMNCQPNCDNRQCGEDGCGSSCGTCLDGLFCLGDSITTEDGSIPPSSCEEFKVCDGNNPVCEGCGETQICASDCQCYDSLEDLPDLVVIVEHMLDESFLHDVDIPETSCSLVEGCVNEPGLRRLLRFTSSVLNQGKADVNFPEPKDRPDLFEFGPCHQHYHFRRFAEYKLYEPDGNTVALSGRKYAYCMEDTVRHFDGANVGCDKVYDCGFQGIQKGWLDSYGWSLDCSWIDVTDLSPGSYVLEITANPARVFPELSFDNNSGRIRVEIPQVDGLIAVPLKLETAVYDETEDVVDVGDGGSGEGTEDGAPGQTDVDVNDESSANGIMAMTSLAAAMSLLSMAV